MVVLVCRLLVWLGLAVWWCFRKSRDYFQDLMTWWSPLRWFYYPPDDVVNPPLVPRFNVPSYNRREWPWWDDRRRPVVKVGSRPLRRVRQTSLVWCGMTWWSSSSLQRDST